MSLATAAPAPLSRQCGSTDSGNSVLRKLTAAANLYEAQQPSSLNAIHGGPATGPATAWLQHQQRLHPKDAESCEGGIISGQEDREREEGATIESKKVPQHQQYPQGEPQDAHLQRLLASEGFMRCETLNLFRAQLQQLSRRKDGLMPRADGSFPENWLLLAWEYQGLAEEVMSCQRWPGKYPEGLLRCVTHQVLYLKNRLEGGERRKRIDVRAYLQRRDSETDWPVSRISNSMEGSGKLICRHIYVPLGVQGVSNTSVELPVQAFPTMSGAERDQFRRLYVLAALGIIAKLKLVTFCWTFVELKRGGEMAEQVTEGALHQNSWQMHLSGNTAGSSLNIDIPASTSAASAPGREPLVACTAPSLGNMTAFDAPSVRIKKRSAVQQASNVIQSSNYDMHRSSRKKEDRQRLREDQQHQGMRLQEHERNSAKFNGQHPQEPPQQQGRQRRETEHPMMQGEKLMAQEQVGNGRGTTSTEHAFFPSSMAGTVGFEAEIEFHGKFNSKIEEIEAGAAQEVASRSSFSSHRTEITEEHQAAATSSGNEGKLYGAEGSKRAETKQHEQLLNATMEIQEEEKPEAPEKTKYTTRSGRRTHRVKADVS